MDTKCALAVATAALAAAAGCTASSARTSGERAATPPMRVGCDQIILDSKRPFAGGYRRVLGVIAAPPAYIPQVVRNPDGPWPYWEKAGLVVCAGRQPIDVSVPANWRDRAAITWGNAKPSVSALRIAPCPSPAGAWHAYAGGFSLRSRGACVPLVFRVGRERQVVRFGIRIRCEGES